MTTFTNGRVTLTKDLVFGICVLAESGWHPVNQLDGQDAQTVLDLLGHNPTCPAEFMAAVRAALEAAKVSCPHCGTRTINPCDITPGNPCQHSI